MLCCWKASEPGAHFTVLGFTAANGEPLLCAILFAAKSMKREWVTGFDPFADWIRNEKTLRRIVVRTNLILLAQLVSLIAKRFLAFAEPL